jgi:hypothetical protein
MLEQGPAGPFIKSFLGSDFAFLRTQQGFHSSVVGFHNSAHARLKLEELAQSRLAQRADASLCGPGPLLFFFIIISVPSGHGSGG